jgi:hypothetical protein
MKQKSQKKASWVVRLRSAGVELELGCRPGKDPGMPTVPAALRDNENATA